MSRLGATESKDRSSKPSVVGSVVPGSFLSPQPSSRGFSGQAQRTCDQVPALSCVHRMWLLIYLSLDPEKDARDVGWAWGIAPSPRLEFWPFEKCRTPDSSTSHIQPQCLVPGSLSLPQSSGAFFECHLTMGHLISPF